MNCKNKNHSCNSCGEKKCGNKHTTCHNADVVEVVRCKDCVWWEPDTYGSLIGRCENPHNGLVNEYTDDIDYCSYGKRKQNEQR